MTDLLLRLESSYSKHIGMTRSQLFGLRLVPILCKVKRVCIVNVDNSTIIEKKPKIFSFLYVIIILNLMGTYHVFSMSMSSFFTLFLTQLLFFFSLSFLS